MNLAKIIFLCYFYVDTQILCHIFSGRKWKTLLKNLIWQYIERRFIMTLNQLRYFCTASRCHSITKAAEELYVTQPTISMAIRDLEIEFGISLFSRKGNQLSLTQEGESFYKKATYILQYCNELQADYSSMSRIKPPLRIGIPPMLRTVFFPELLTAYHEKLTVFAVVRED